MKLKLASPERSRRTTTTASTSWKAAKAKNKPHPVFKMNKFVELLESKGITVGGKVRCGSDAVRRTVLEDDYFGDMCNAYPELQPLRQCRKSLNSLEPVRNRARQGRVQPRHRNGCSGRPPAGTALRPNFLCSRPHWVRNLLAPRPGRALVACDVTGAEDWLAAGLTGDPGIMRIYSSGADSTWNSPQSLARFGRHPPRQE